MDENVGVLTRSQAKKMQQPARDPVANRRSYPPDSWTVEDDHPDITAKQRRTLHALHDLVVLPDNKAHQDDEEPTKVQFCVRKDFQQQSVSAGVLQASKPARRKVQHSSHQLYLPALMPLPDSPVESQCIPETPPRKILPIPHGIDDIDAEADSLDTNCYAREIMEYLQYLEAFGIPHTDYLDKSPEVTTRMRGVLMDWILQVQTHEELKEETLHLCVFLVDQVLGMVNVKMSRLQLVGITCLLIASKFRERFAPEISVLCYLTENTFCPAEVIRYEMFILSKVDFKLSRPVCNNFLERYFQVHQNPIEVEHLSNYILDLSLTSVSMVPVLPSLKAAGALYLSRFLLLDDDDHWTPSLTYYSTYKAEDLHVIVKDFAIMLLKAPSSKYQGARSKYNSKEFAYISYCDHVESSYILLKCFGKGVSSP